MIKVKNYLSLIKFSHTIFVSNLESTIQINFIIPFSDANKKPPFDKLRAAVVFLRSQGGQGFDGGKEFSFGVGQRYAI